MDQELDEMSVRHYVVDRVEGPANGSWSLVAKDLLSRIELKKAMAPRASQGRLASGITSSDVSATLEPTGIGDLEYPASGRIRVGDEVIAFTRSGDTLTLTQRGDLNTEAADHDADDVAQLVLSYSAQSVEDIVYDLITNYSEIEAASIPKTTQWDVQAADIAELYTAHITEPTPVEDLIGELAEQVGFSLFTRTDTNEIYFVALRATAPAVTVTDREWIIDGSLSLKRQDDKRVSEVWVYYGQINPTEGLEERKNFRSIAVTTSGENNYGSDAIREVFSRWIPAQARASANATGERILAIFQNPPREAAFPIHISRDGELELAKLFSLETAEFQDFTGAVEPVTMAPIMLHRDGARISVEAQELVFTGETDGVRRIYIESDTFNVNLRALYDSQYSSVAEEIEFIIESGVTVGSTSTSAYALRTGLWPEAPAITLANHGRIQGRGGDGGAGGTVHWNGNTTMADGQDGQPGGPAMLAEDEITVDNTDGAIWGGAGGGAGGGAAIEVIEVGGVPADANACGGSGGGGGQGTNGGAGGDWGYATGDGTNRSGFPGTAGTSDAPGQPGSRRSKDGATSGTGGAGGAPGQAGSNGQNGVAGTQTSNGGTGGAAGAAVVGDSFITWTATGDRKGTVS